MSKDKLSGMSSESFSHPDPSDGPQNPGSPNLSTLKIINLILQYRRMIIRSSCVLFLIVVGYSYQQQRSFTVTASFLLEMSDVPNASILGLASQFGVTMPNTGTNLSPAFYAALLRSRPIITQIVEHPYSFTADGEDFTGDLMNLFEISKESYQKRREAAIKLMEEKISVRAERDTGLIKFYVTTPWAPLSTEVSAKILELVNTFNLETRQTRAEGERRFIAGRLDTVRLEMKSAEDALQLFIDQNNRWPDSPQLTFNHDRLQREVLMRQQIVTSLSQSFEQARIDEVRDTPVITIVEKPEIPVYPNPRNLYVKGLLGLVLGALISIFWILGRYYLSGNSTWRTEQSIEFANLKQDTIYDLMRPWRLLGRTPHSDSP